MKFSTTAFVVVFLLHAAGTVLFVFVAFGAAMSAFNHPAAEAKQSIDALDFLGWFWSTGPRAFQYFFGVPATLFVDFLWSLVLGTTAGFVFARRRTETKLLNGSSTNNSKSPDA